MKKILNFNLVAIALLVVCVFAGIMPESADAMAYSMAAVGSTGMVDLRAERARAVQAARELHERAEAENRDLTADENEAYSRNFKAAEELRARIDRAEKLEAADRELAAVVLDHTAEASAADTKAIDLQAQAFAQALKGGMGSLTEDLRNALDTTTTETGGALVAPKQFVADLLKTVDDMVFIRRLATVSTVTGTDSIGRPALDNDPADSDWTSELATGNEDSTMSFGGRELKPHPLAKRIKVSNTMLRRSAIPVEALVRDRLAYKFGITEEKAFLTGSGANQPLGIFTASTSGISTSRDVTAAAATTLTGDDFIKMKYQLKANYWANAQWVMHRDVVEEVAKLKGSDGHYLWRMSLRDGEPDMLLGRPVNMSEYAPNTITSGLYTAMLGDFSNYWIADEQGFTIQRLNELYAENNQTGFIARSHVDGMPALEEAFARLKQA